MNLHVGFHISYVVESFTTKTTGVRFLSCVDPHMDFPISSLTELFTTKTATVRFLSGVDSHVDSFIAARTESLVANTAVESLFVDFQVICQTVCGLNIFSTHTAD